MCPLYIAFCSGLGHQHTKGADGSRYQSIYEPTEPSQPMMSDDVNEEDGPQHRKLRLGRKYARIFVLEHYLFLEAHSFPRAALSENCSLLGTDNFRGQIS